MGTDSLNFNESAVSFTALGMQVQFAHMEENIKGKSHKCDIIPCIPLILRLKGGGGDDD